MEQAVRLRRALGSLRTWLSLLAHRRAVDWVRGEARHHKDARADDLALHAVPDSAPGPAEAVVDRERSLLLHTALAELPQPQREVVHLACFAPDMVPREATGDAAAVRNVLERAASLSWL